MVIPFLLPQTREFVRTLRGHALADLYISQAIRSFAVHMLGVFEPIYLYLFFQRHGIEPAAAIVCFYYGLFFFFFGIFTPFGANFANRFGFPVTALVSTPFLFLYHLLLLGILYLPWLLPFAFVSLVIRASLFWPSFHFVFASVSNSGERGRALSGLTIVETGAAILGPLIGGLILVRFGYPALFLTAFPFLIASALPFFLLGTYRLPYRTNIRRVAGEVFALPVIKGALAFAASGAKDSFHSHLWPLFLFLLAISFDKLGLVASAGIAASVVATALFGYTSDFFGRVRTLRFGVLLTAAGWMLRGFVSSLSGAFFANTFYNVGRAGIAIPFGAIFYDAVAASKNPYQIVLFREVALNLGRTLFLFLAGGIIALFGLFGFRAVFFLAAVLALVMALIEHWDSARVGESRTS